MAFRGNKLNMFKGFVNIVTSTQVILLDFMHTLATVPLDIMSAGIQVEEGSGKTSIIQTSRYPCG